MIPQCEMVSRKMLAGPTVTRKVVSDAKDTSRNRTIHLCNTEMKSLTQSFQMSSMSSSLEESLTLGSFERRRLDDRNPHISIPMANHMANRGNQGCKSFSHLRQRNYLPTEQSDLLHQAQAQQNGVAPHMTLLEGDIIGNTCRVCGLPGMAPIKNFP